MNDNQETVGEEGKAKPILIKKYPNRRLYNTQTSSYIVLDDVVALVKAGTEFVIEDTKTGEDLTRSILNQIIYERETANADFHFPLDVQKQLIMMYDDAYGKMMPDYLRESMNLFVNEREKMKSAYEEMVSFNSKTMTEFGERLAEQNMNMFNQTFDFFQAMSGVGRTANRDKKDVENKQDTGDKQGELKEIQAQIDALQEKLKSIDT